MHLDSCFLIDLHREKFRRQDGPAHRFLKSHPAEPFSVSVVAAMEYCEGFEDKDLWKGQRFLEPFEIVPIGQKAALRASRIRRSLRIKGLLLPDNDILIAACSMEAGQPLATRNADHFCRIEGLEIVNYRS
jgi:predicted nucleic acid-binding protein